MKFDSVNFRYEVIEEVGRGAFGCVYKVRDHKDWQIKALKVIKNKPNLKEQALVEINIVKTLNKWDPKDKKNVVKLLDDFEWFDHACIVFELLSVNLYQFIKGNSYKGFSLNLTRRFAI